MPHLAILTAAAPGEISWCSPQLKNSVFAEQVARGLLGEADRIQKSRDDRVTLQELFEFVREGTNHWVVQNRDLRGQHPNLILPKPEAAAKDLLATIVGRVSGKPAVKATPPKTASTSDVLADLIQLWNKRDKLKEAAAPENSPEQVDPLAWRGLHEQLRRAERQYLAGQPNGVSEFKAQAEELKQRILFVDDRYIVLKNKLFGKSSERESSRNSDDGGNPAKSKNKKTKIYTCF